MQSTPPTYNNVGSIQGPAGAKGDGWKSEGTGYDAGTGKVTFASDDGLEFTTGDLRGADASISLNTTVPVTFKTDCSAGGSGSFTDEGSDTWKLALTMPRGQHVYTGAATGSGENIKPDDQTGDFSTACTGDIWSTLLIPGRLMADPKKVKVFDGTNWVDLKADDPNLPISSTDNKVTLSDDDGKFQIETGDPKSVRVTVDKEGRLSVGESSNNVMNYFGNDNPADYVGGSCYGVYADGKCQTAATVYSVSVRHLKQMHDQTGRLYQRLIHYQTYYDTGGGNAVKCEVIEQIGLNLLAISSL